MKTVKFAYIAMGKNYNATIHRTCIKNDYNNTSVFGVGNIEEAYDLVKQLAEDGYECIELCGAFEEQNVRNIIKLTNAKIAIGFSTHLPEQDILFNSLFGN